VFSASGTTGNPIIVTAYNGTPIMDGEDDTGTAFWSRGKSYINLSGITIFDYDDAVNFDGWSGSVYEGFTEIYISDMIIYSTEGSAIILNAYPNHSSIINCTVTDNNWNSLAIYGTSGDITDPNKHAHDITINNCSVYGPFGHSAIDLFGDLQYINVINSEWNGTLFSHSTVGWEYNNSYWNISNNIIYDSPSHGMYFTSYNSTISNNIITNVSGDGIKSYINCTNNTYQNNTIYDGTYSGFYIVGYDNYFIENNVTGHTVGSVYDYRTDYGDNVIRDAVGDSFKCVPAYAGVMTIEFTDGRIFSEDGDNSTLYYNSKSKYMTTGIDVLLMMCPTLLQMSLKQQQLRWNL